MDRIASAGRPVPLRDGPAVLTVDRVSVDFKVAGRTLSAVSDVSFDVRRGETLGLVGESGCGKSTTGRVITMLTRPTSGRVVFDGEDLAALSHRRLRSVRRRLQVIFQDPRSSINPRRHVGAVVAEGLAATQAAKPWDARIEEVLSAVGLDVDAVLGRKPAELSGGQCQRVAIARALIVNPALIICDEAVSALDVSIQAQILNLLEEMKDRFDLTMLFIAHDLSVVRSISDRVAVMYLGMISEIGHADEIFSSPLHPYTQALIDAVPDPDPDQHVRPMPALGDIPSPLDPPSGCRFRTRCPRAESLCERERPELTQMGSDHYVACHFPGPRSD